MSVPSLILLAGSAGFVGLVHSLAPGHWLPVVLLVKARRWSRGRALLGALVAASGHVAVSLAVSAAAIFLGASTLASHEEQIERYSGVILVAFGLAYALFAFRRHSHCHEHGHHGPEFVQDRKGRRGPFLFLFSIGLSPCVAVLPVLVAAAPKGGFAIGVTMLAFAGGVVFALAGATLLSLAFGRVLDIPLFEHHGDVLTGFGVALLGVALFFWPF